MNELYILLPGDHRVRHVHPGVVQGHPVVRNLPDHRVRRGHPGAGHLAAVPGIHPGVLQTQGRQGHPAAVLGIHPGVLRRDRQGHHGDRRDLAGRRDYRGSRGSRGSRARRACRGG
ncbi:uncharacterized protein N7518_008793 [Penicillium psychrosexuale]|uniref:uncharacterized protein n=1 Tax=Penicillium psychrosexuale TaxID=1002107 RepID=UPI00254598E7|nr:uncharacterized protein N7518_008793 [Penicillium psychrosexuale]KAJ5791782.1 hypothetical protein N7518_008793 [Penicillium psychrosexuale]